MQNWVGVQVDTMEFFLAGLKEIYQGEAGRHEAPVAHCGSCKVKLCMTRLVVLHITVNSSVYKTIALFCCHQRTLTAATRELWADLPLQRSTVDAYLLRKA